MGIQQQRSVTEDRHDCRCSILHEVWELPES